MSDWEELFVQYGFDTVDANGDNGASISQMSLLLELESRNWEDVDDAVDAGELDEVVQRVEQPNGDIVERVVRYRCPSIEVAEVDDAEAA